MWNSSLVLDKYQYVRTHPNVIRLLGLLGILTTLLMGYGFLRYVRSEFIYLLVFGPIVAIFIFNKLLRFSLQLVYPKFDIKKHEKFVNTFWSTHAEPSVDIFLPYAGEDLTIHEEVVKALSHLQYKNFQVYMLDDKGSTEHNNLAEKYGFHYLSRPNKGEYKKSGNLEYGYAHSTGEFVLILDADFIPTKDSLHDLIPYIVSDPEIGILQTPQYFEQTNDVHKRSKIEFGGGNIVEDFYRVIMPCRDEFKAGMCVGTSAVYRRTAIEKLHGTPKVHASEDLATGLLITHHGFYVKYLPLIVSMGKSPESFQGYFKQHMRWCSGNLVFAKYWPFAHLSLVARIIYIVNPLYYLSEALTVVFSFQFLLLLYFHTNSLNIENTLYFIPYLILSRIIIPFTKTNKNKLGTKLAAMSNSYTYFYTYIRMLTKGVPSWHPTGVKLNSLHDDFVNAINIGTFISSFFIICFLFVILSKPMIFGNYNTYIVLLWTFYSVFWHALFLTFVLDYIHPFKRLEISNAIQKAFLYVKTNSMILLFFILLGAAMFDVTISSFNSSTPTRLLLASLLNKKSELAENPNLQTKVLAATTKMQITPTPDENEYIYTVQKGDTLYTIAQNAITKYAYAQNITMNQDQINYASLLLSKDDINGTFAVGNVISFNEALIDQSVNAAFSKYKTQSNAPLIAVSNVNKTNNVKKKYGGWYWVSSLQKTLMYLGEDKHGHEIWGTGFPTKTEVKESSVTAPTATPEPTAIPVIKITSAPTSVVTPTVSKSPTPTVTNSPIPTITIVVPTKPVVSTPSPTPH